MQANINRRNFLKAVGLGGLGSPLLGCDLPSTVTLEEGREDVVSYFAPEEYVIPGVGVWYASTCTQCPSGCGVHGRVREGRILKIEGNPSDAINHGKLCQMGQAGLQGHYNPDRLTTPLVREGDRLVPTSWQNALALLKKKVGDSGGIDNGGIDGSRIAWVTGSISGHQSALLNNYLDVIKSRNLYVTEVIHAAGWQAVCADMLGDSLPRLRIDKAKLVLSFGADFLGTWLSPVHFAGQFAKFRSPPHRGALIQVESKMSLTGANADLWVAIKPGTEGTFALGLAHFLLNQPRFQFMALPPLIREGIKDYTSQKVERITGTTKGSIERIGKALTERLPSLILAGASVEGHEHSYDAIAAIMLLNIILGNAGRTIEASSDIPYDQLKPQIGSTHSLLSFADELTKKRFDTVFFYNTNPVFLSPNAAKLKENLQSVSFKVALAQFPDETTMMADLVLPITSSLEEWGTHVPAYQSSGLKLGLQQPLMEKLHKETKSFGDILLSLLKMRDKEQYGGFEDYYDYLRKSLLVLKQGTGTLQVLTDTFFWNQSVQKGAVDISGSQKALQKKFVAINLPDKTEEGEYPLHLVPAPRLGLYDGRHANLPWLQESPDHITKVVWDSWAELHPSTADKLGVRQGDIIEVTSKFGSLKTQVYITKGMHPSAIAIPLGQGHEEYGRYARGVGVNPLKILSTARDKKSGEWAMFATKVKVTNTGQRHVLVKMGGSDTQVGRKFVRTIPASVVNRNERT